MRQWRTVHCGSLCASESAQNQRHATLLRHSKRDRGSQQARFLSGMRFATFGGISAEGCGITASSLDDPRLFRPQFDIFTSDAQPWAHMDPELPKFERYMPSDS